MAIHLMRLRPVRQQTRPPLLFYNPFRSAGNVEMAVAQKWLNDEYIHLVFGMIYTRQTSAMYSHIQKYWFRNHFITLQSWAA